MGKFDGKVAVVTGAGRGIGRGHALLLASEGARVIVNDLGATWDGSGQDTRPAAQTVGEIRAAGGEAEANFDDTADWAGAQRMIGQALESYGGLDFLVCNAGIVRDRTVFNMSEQEWDAVVAVHLKGHFAPTRFATAYWRDKTKSTGVPVGARVIYTSSESGLYGNGGQVNYAAVKAGIAAMGIVVSREMKKYGVTANSIAPRARTRMTESTFGSLAIEADRFDQWHPDNIAPLVGYLCSDEAAHVTGQTFVVGGGLIQLTQGWTVVNSVEKNGRWTIDDIASSSSRLFNGRSTDTPVFAMEMPGLPVLTPAADLSR